MIKQISLFVENCPGSLNKVCQLLKKENISIRTLSLADTQQFGILRLLVKDYEIAKTKLENEGFLVKLSDVIAISVPDKPGGLADILDVLDKHQLTVEYLYAFTFGLNDKAVIVIRFEEANKAMEVLENEAVEIVHAADLFKG